MTQKTKVNLQVSAVKIYGVRLYKTNTDLGLRWLLSFVLNLLNLQCDAISQINLNTTKQAHNITQYEHFSP